MINFTKRSSEQPQKDPVNNIKINKIGLYFNLFDSDNMTTLDDWE